MKAIALILAAGKGTRMKSDLIKVLHPILGRSMVGWSIDIARGAGLQPCIVVGHQEDRVRNALANEDVSFARQSTPQGTGHAVLCALDMLPKEGTLLVMFGDTPLFRSETLSHLLSVHKKEGNLATFLTATIDEAGSYGRLIRDADGRPLRIVEAAEASAEAAQSSPARRCTDVRACCRRQSQFRYCRGRSAGCAFIALPPQPTRPSPV